MVIVKTSFQNESKGFPLRTLAGLPIVLTLSLSSFIGPFGGYMLIPVLKEASIEFMIEEITMGFAITVYMIPFSILQLFSGYFGDVYSKKGVITLGAVVYSLGSLFAYFSYNFPIFLLARILQGIGSALMTPISMALVGDLYVRSLRGRIMGIMTVSIALGGIVGSILGGIIGLVYWRYIFLVMFGVGIVLSLMIIFFIPQVKSIRKRSQIRFLSTYKEVIINKWVLFIGLSGSLIFYVRWSIITFLSYVVRSPPYNLDPKAWGGFLSLAGWGGLFAGFVAGILIGKFGEEKVIRLGFTSLLLIFMIFLTDYWFYYLPIVFFLLGFFSSFTFTALNTLILEVQRDFRGTATSVYGSMRFIGFALGPIAPAPAYIIWGFSGVMIINIIAVIIITILWFLQKFE